VLGSREGSGMMVAMDVEFLGTKRQKETERDNFGRQS